LETENNSARHVQFIALGGIIGTGLFVGTGSALVRAGPLSILLAYSIVGTVIYSLMLAIGEVCCPIYTESLKRQN
jgi:amino acid transporter